MSRQLLETRKDSLLQSSVLAHYLEASAMKEILARVAEGKTDRDEGRLVWRWLVIESWHRQFQQAAAGK